MCTTISFSFHGITHVAQNQFRHALRPIGSRRSAARLHLRRQQRCDSCKCADRVQCRPNPNRSDSRMEHFELSVCPSQSSDCLTPTTKESSVRLRCRRARGLPNQHCSPSRRLSFGRLICQFARTVLNPYIDLQRIPTTPPSSGRRSSSASSEQASLSMGAMMYALEMSKTTISSSSSSALLFGSSLLTISRHRAEKFMCHRQFFGLRLELLANQPTSDVWSTWVDLVHQDPSNRHRGYSSSLRLWVSCDGDGFFSPKIFL